MTRAEFVQEFERRTGLRLCWEPFWFRREPGKWAFSPYNYGEGLAMEATTKSLYSRAHLEAAVKAVGEVSHG